MSAPWIVGLVIASNVAVLVGGLIWMRRQVKRVAAERAGEYRGLFKLEPLPAPGKAVQILVEEDGGAPAELDAVHWPHLGWIDACKLMPVDGDVIGWRQHPFRRPLPVEYTRLTREELEAELESRFGCDRQPNAQPSTSDVQELRKCPASPRRSLTLP